MRKGLGVLPAIVFASFGVWASEPLLKGFDGEPLDEQPKSWNLSPDERLISFKSGGRNIHPDYITPWNLQVLRHWLYDRDTGQARMLGRASNLSGTFGSNGSAVISRDGRFAAFAAMRAHEFDATVPGDFDDELIMLLDLDTGVYRAFPQNLDGTWPGDGSPTTVYDRFNEQHMAISPDGRFVAFRAQLGSIAAGGSAARDDLYAYDRETGTVMLVAEGKASVGRHVAGPRLWFLQDRRLVTSMPFGPDERMTVVAFSTLGAPPVALVEGLAESVTPDGRFVFLGPDVYERVDLVTGERTRHCALQSPSSCIGVRSVSADGAVVMYTSGKVEHTARRQVIDALPGSSRVAADGLSLYRNSTVGPLQYGLAEIKLEVSMSVHRRIREIAAANPDDDPSYERDVIAEYRLRNAGQVDTGALVWSSPPTRMGSHYTPEFKVEHDLECIPPSEPPICAIENLAPGAERTLRYTWVSARPGVFDLNTEVRAQNHWTSTDSKLADAVSFDLPWPDDDDGIPKPAPSTPAPAPKPPPLGGGGGGGGSFGWWAVVLMTVGATLLSRLGRAVRDEGRTHLSRP